jgi:hypothetical protein
MIVHESVPLVKPQEKYHISHLDPSEVGSGDKTRNTQQLRSFYINSQMNMEQSPTTSSGWILTEQQEGLSGSLIKNATRTQKQNDKISLEETLPLAVSGTLEQYFSIIFHKVPTDKHLSKDEDRSPGYIMGEFIKSGKQSDDGTRRVIVSNTGLVVNDIGNVNGNCLSSRKTFVSRLFHF